MWSCVSDLCLDVDSPSSNEVSPSHMKLLDPSVRGAARIRSQAIREGCHLTLELGGWSLGPLRLILG